MIQRPDWCDCPYCTIRLACYDGDMTRTEAKRALMLACDMTDAEAYETLTDID